MHSLAVSSDPASQQILVIRVGVMVIKIPIYEILARGSHGVDYIGDDGFDSEINLVKKRNLGHINPWIERSSLEICERRWIVFRKRIAV